MENNARLYEQLKRYADTGNYPFHMPGHKRQLREGISSDFPNPYKIDITEIEGFDNLHHAEGIIQESMEWVASLYGADKSYYLINGSSGGILSAICGCTKRQGTLLMSRNCHKSVYHGVFLNCLKSRYLYPQFMEKYGIFCGLDPEKVNMMLKTFDDISAVLVVSPTYDGVVSDIETIAGLCHDFGVPLIVDEAHGAHFRYGDIFPVSALDLGADVVIQSLHKTLPCFTQSAILHVKKGCVNRENIEKYLQIYQSSSPSYILMAGIERGIRWMEEDGRERIKEFSLWLLDMRRELSKMKYLKLVDRDIIGRDGVFDLDISKVIISVKGSEMNGRELCDRLRQEYHLEMEMCTEDYVTAITTVMDTKEGLDRLRDALLEIDEGLERENLHFVKRKGDLQEGFYLEKEWDEYGKKERNIKDGGREWETRSVQNIRDTKEEDKKRKEEEIRKEEAKKEKVTKEKVRKEVWEIEAQTEVTISEAWSGESETVDLEASAGRISAEFIYLYPPGIPVIAPGEKITDSIIETVIRYREEGLPVQGLRDTDNCLIDVLTAAET